MTKQKLKTIKSLVADALEEHEELRDDDNALYGYICFKINRDVLWISLTDCMNHLNKLGLPTYESVRRTRQKLQAESPLIYGSSGFVRENRKANRAIYEEFFK
jgi:hypothetical protein